MARTDTPAKWDERSTLLTMLQYTRDTAAAKCEGIAAEYVGATPLATSPLMSIGGVVNHMRWVEHSWIENRFVGGPDLGPWTDEEPDKEFTIGAETPIGQLLEEYADQARRTDAIVGGLDLDARSQTPRDRRAPDAPLGAAAPRRGERQAQRTPRHPARDGRRRDRRLTERLVSARRRRRRSGSGRSGGRRAGACRSAR